MSSPRQLLNRFDLLTLRTPARRFQMLQRFETLRQELRKMGFAPEDLDGLQMQGKTLNLVEKVVALGVIYCGLDYDRVVELLAEPCNLPPDLIPGLASRLRRSVGQPGDVIGPAVQLLMQGVQGQTALDLSPERTLAEIAILAFGDLGQLAQWDVDGNLTFTPSDLLTRGQRALVSELTVTRGRGGEVTTKIKLQDKLKALEMLARHQGLLSEKVEINVDISLAERLQKARVRVFEGELEREALTDDRQYDADDAFVRQNLSDIPDATFDRARQRALVRSGVDPGAAGAPDLSAEPPGTRD